MNPIHRIAILDLGTNTFNLLIAEMDKQQMPLFIFTNELPVELGKDGIQKKEITAEAIQRAINALLMHRQKMGEFEIKEYYAFATSAVRDAANGKEFIRIMRKETGIDIKILSGEEEAIWIYEGVKHARLLRPDVSVIMDIGGGSTEFVICNEEQILWMNSYPLGVTRLYELFYPADPLFSKKEQVEKHITSMLKDLFEAAKIHKPVELIGCSGSFESFAEILISRAASPPTEGKILNPLSGGIGAINGYDFPLKQFRNLCNDMVVSTLEERLSIPGLISMRAPMFAYSAVLTEIVLKRLSIQKMTLSRYAMKEGIAGQYLEM